MLRRPQYAPPPSWGQPTPAARPASPWPRIIAGLAAAALFIAIWFRAGLFALVLALVLGGLFMNRRDKGRFLVELVAAGMLALTLAGAPAPKAPTVPKVKAAKADAVQADQLAELRDTVAETWAKVATYGSNFIPDPKEQR